MDPEGKLLDIAEHTRIEKRQGGIASTEDGGETWEDLDPDTVVSMNLWGFSPSILEELNRRFPEFLEEHLEQNPLKCEYQLPAVVGQLLKEEKASVEVLHTPGYMVRGYLPGGQAHGEGRHPGHGGEGRVSPGVLKYRGGSFRQAEAPSLYQREEKRCPEGRCRQIQRKIRELRKI